jgi:protein involved in polysaccharide export with SLBB domain
MRHVPQRPRRLAGAAVAILCLVAAAGARAQVSGSQGAPAWRDRLNAYETKTPSPAPPVADIQDEAEKRAGIRYGSPDLLDAEVDAATYVLGPYDMLNVVIISGDTRSQVLQVLPEGVVVVPNVGPVAAAGRTLAEFRTVLHDALARRYRGFELYCNLARQRQFRVYVTGEVRSPGVLAARPTERVSDVLDRAGGLTDRASKREIELRDAAGTVRAYVDLGRFLACGDLAGNPWVLPGAVVHVPPRGRIVTVAGEVRAPGGHEVRAGDSVRDLVELAGGPTDLADLEHVTVEHTDGAGNVSIETVDLRDEAPSAAAAWRVTVLSKLLGHPRVYFITPDDRQQTLLLAPGETLASLVHRTATLPADADLAAAQLATRDAKGRPVLVPVDLRRVLAGDQDRPLQDGDVLSVPGVKGYVYVSGHVAKPGRYAYRADWNVSDYVGEAGGPTIHGARNRARLLGQDGAWRGVDRSTIVQRGETVFVERSRGGQMGTVIAVLGNLTAVAISVVALTR